MTILIRWIYFLIMATFLISCTVGNHTFTSVCYKEKYNTLLLDGARTFKKIVNDKCYETTEVVRWQYKKIFSSGKIKQSSLKSSVIYP